MVGLQCNLYTELFFQCSLYMVTTIQSFVTYYNVFKLRPSPILQSEGDAFIRMNILLGLEQ